MNAMGCDATTRPVADFPQYSDDIAENRRRWAPSESDKTMLEKSYGVDPFPSAAVRSELASELSIAPRQVQVWFQNRRQKERAKNNTKDASPSSPDSSSGAPVPPAPASPPLTAPPPQMTKSTELGTEQLRPPSLQMLPPPPVSIIQRQPAMHPQPALHAPQQPTVYTVPNQQMMALFFARSYPSLPLPTTAPAIPNNVMGANVISPEQLLELQRQLKAELSKNFARTSVLPNHHGVTRGISKPGTPDKPHKTVLPNHKALPRAPAQYQGVPMDRRSVSIDAIEVLSSQFS